MEHWIDNEEITKNITLREMRPELTTRSVSFIHDRKGKDQPSFLSIPFNSLVTLSESKLKFFASYFIRTQSQRSFLFKKGIKTESKQFSDSELGR